MSGAVGAWRIVRRLERAFIKHLRRRERLNFIASSGGRAGCIAMDAISSQLV